MPKSRLRTSPLNDFKVPIASWRPNEQQFKEFQDKSRITYTIPERIEINGKEWYSVAAYNVENVLLGEFILPFKYYPLWRRLIYGALFQEKLYNAWIQRTRRLKGRRLNAVEEEEIRLRNMSGVRMVQYLLYRRVVLEELMSLRFENHEPVVHSLIEFSIRDSRDWMFETFENAKKEGAAYLRLDPTLRQNKKEFEKGYHSGLEILFPPDDDNWWDGEFTHFDFKATFNEIVKSVPKTMADTSFENVKWTIECTGANEPVEWNEAKIAFFSESFVAFLTEEGLDPRDNVETYIRRYLILEDGDLPRISQELQPVLGDRYDEQRVGALVENLDLDEFLRELGYKEGQTEHALPQGPSEGMSVAAADSRVGTLQENVGSGPWDGELGEAGRSAAADEGGGKGQGNISSGPADAEMGEAGGSTGGVPLAAAAGEGEGATSRAFSEYAMHSFQLLS